MQPRFRVFKFEPLATNLSGSGPPVGAGRGSGDGAGAGWSVIAVAALEASAVVGCLDDVVMVGKAIEQSGGHLRVSRRQVANQPSFFEPRRRFTSQYTP
jgi:hypothetical protein